MKSGTTARLQRADMQLRAGGGLTVVGMILTLVAMSPAVLGGHLASIWWALAMVTGVGLVVVISGLRRSASARSAAVKATLGEG
mgnify:FL=1